MADKNADDIISLHEKMASTRGVLDNHLREVAERVRPSQNYFQQIMRPDGDKRNEKIFDDTAPLALPKFAAAVISMSFPATQVYQRLTIDDEIISNDSACKRYFEQVNNILFKARYSPYSGFQSQTGETVLDIGAFGTGILFIDDLIGHGIRYKSKPLAYSYIAEDNYGRVDTLSNKFEFTAKQAVQEFGLNNLPKSIQQAYDKFPTQKFWFLHMVKPNMDKKAGRRDYTGMDFYSCYISMEDRMTVSEGGFRVFPFAVPRYETAPSEVYGRSPAMKVLPTIKTLNEMQKTILRAAQIVVAPPIMLSDDGSLSAFDVRPNALNPGYVSQDGRPMAIPFESKGRVDIGRDMLNDLREVINDAFFVTLFRILVEEPQITATEAMLRAQEKGQLLAPTMGRIQTELLGPTTDREIDILQMSGVLPQMPDKLIEYYQNGGQHKIEYQSPLNLAQKAGAGVAIMNTLNALAPLAQIDPKVLLRYDIPKAGQLLGQINGVPEEVIRSDEEVAALEDAQNQQAQAQQLLAAAPVAASAAKDMAQAQSLAGSSPSQVAPNILPA